MGSSFVPNSGALKPVTFAPASVVVGHHIEPVDALKKLRERQMAKLVSIRRDSDAEVVPTAVRSRQPAELTPDFRHQLGKVLPIRLGAKVALGTTRYGIFPIDIDTVEQSRKGTKRKRG